MHRIQPIDTEKAEGKRKELLDKLKAKMGKLPNIFKHMAASPAALEAYIGLSGALNQSSLSTKQREQIALAIAEETACEYCLAAHTAIGRKMGLSDVDILQSRRSGAEDSKTNAALRFAVKIARSQGKVTDSDLRQTREAGFSEGEILEILLTVILNLYTNYFNHIVQPEIDFPKAEPIVVSSG